MIRIGRVLVLLGALLLQAFSTNPSHLTPVVDVDVLNLRASYEFDSDRSSAMCKWQYHYRLAPGQYFGKYRDKEGTYYLGKPGNVQEDVLVASCMKALPPVAEHEGGIFLPDDRSKPGRIFFYLRANEDFITNGTWQAQNGSASQGPVVSAVSAGLNAAEEGNIWFPPFQPKDDSLANLLAEGPAAQPD
jgi:hypothetical protein